MNIGRCPSLLYNEIGAIWLDCVQWKWIKVIWPSSSCCHSVAQWCLTLCDPMDCSMPGFPVFHYLPEFAQTQVHWVDDAIQPSHPLSSSSPPALALSQHQGLFQWVSSSHQSGWNIGASVSASFLPMNIQDWFSLGLTGLISLLSKVLSRVFSSTEVRKHQFFGAQPSLWSNSHICTWVLGKPRKGNGTPLLPGKAHGWRSLVGCSPWGH